MVGTVTIVAVLVVVLVKLTQRSWDKETLRPPEPILYLPPAGSTVEKRGVAGRIAAFFRRGRRP